MIIRSKGFWRSRVNVSKISILHDAIGDCKILTSDIFIERLIAFLVQHDKTT